MRTPVSTSIAVLVGCTIALGCAESEYAVEGSGDSREVSGEVEIADHPSGDKLVTLSLVDLPPVRTLGGGYDGYVVWLRPMGMETLKAGPLTYYERESLGMARMLTPYESFELYVTAERDSSGAEEPGELVVARRVVQRTH